MNDNYFKTNLDLGVDINLCDLNYKGDSSSNYYENEMINKHNISEVLKDDETLKGINMNQRTIFFNWYPNNIHIINEFEKITRFLHEKTFRKYYSARAIFEHMRWNSMISDNNMEFKLSDNVCSSVVRVVVKLFPEYKNMFRMKGIK